MFKNLPPKLIDCQRHGEGVASELLIVEGDSAANAVANARNADFQAVLPMQGKPLNAFKANKKTVANNVFFSAVIESMGAGWDDSFSIDQMRYERIVLLMDPDADGIHCGMLVLMFFYRWMRPLLDSGRISMVHPPLFQIAAQGFQGIVCAGTLPEAIAESKKLEEEGLQEVVRKPFRGLASMSGAILSKYCIDPTTRKAYRMRSEDAVAAIKVFSPTAK
jgi:DNA gyrase subunit B